VATPLSQAEQAASAVINWNSLAAMNHVTALGDPQFLIEAHWFVAETQAGVPLQLFMTDARQPAQYYQQASLDPRCNCHGETLGPLHPNGDRYNIHEGNVEDILVEGFLQLTPADIVTAGDVVVWLEPNRLAAHSARVEKAVFVGGLLDWDQTVLWSKNGLDLAVTMFLAKLADMYKESRGPNNAVCTNKMEFWRPNPGP
jgi:hypothetical protein